MRTLSLKARLRAWRREVSAGRPAPEPLYNIADDAVVRIEKLENEKYELERVIAEMEYASKQIALMNLRTYGG